MLDALWRRAAQPRRHVADRRLEADMGMLAAQQLDDLLAGTECGSLVESLVESLIG
jgi:hypothetical protein